MQPTTFLSIETWTGLGLRRKQDLKRVLASLAYRRAFSVIKVKSPVMELIPVPRNTVSWDGTR